MGTVSFLSVVPLQQIGSELILAGNHGHLEPENFKFHGLMAWKIDRICDLASPGVTFMRLQIRSDSTSISPHITSN